MARALPTTLIAAMNAAQADVLVLALLEVSHSDITTIRIVNNTEAVTSQGDTFQPFPFSVSLPAEGEDVTPALRAVVSNVDQSIVAAARSVAGSTSGLAKATLHIVDNSAPDTRLITYSEYSVQNLTYSVDVVSFDMTIESFLSEPYPGGTFTPGKFPGLF